MAGLASPRLAPSRPRAAWPAVVGAGALLLGAGTIAGCDSTQEKNERAKLTATRELASRKPLRLGRVNPDVRVTKVSVVRGKRAASYVVDLRSTASETQTDVPILVGVRTRDGRVERLNSKGYLGWFQTHAPAIPAGGRVTWVFRSSHVPAPGDRPFAKVGLPAQPLISSADSLPPIKAVLLEGGGNERKAGKKPRNTTPVSVENVSDVPQYGLQVYALARVGGRYVAAGKVAIEHLGTGQRVDTEIPLAGSAQKHRVRVHTIPTIFE